MNGSSEWVVVDTGPIVALCNRSDRFHAWASAELERLKPPIYTCEAVLSESQWLVHRRGGDSADVLEMVRRGMLNIAFDVEDDVERLLELQRSYRDVPMSLADACVVRMTELHPNSRVMTMDSDFRIYRRHRRNVIPLLAPPGV
jgi:predicted nucleic acid-binding protein